MTYLYNVLKYQCKYIHVNVKLFGCIIFMIKLAVYFSMKNNYLLLLGERHSSFILFYIYFFLQSLYITSLENHQVSFTPQLKAGVNHFFEIKMNFIHQISIPTSCGSRNVIHLSTFVIIVFCSSLLHSVLHSLFFVCASCVCILLYDFLVLLIHYTDICIYAKVIIAHCFSCPHLHLFGTALLSSFFHLSLF